MILKLFQKLRIGLLVILITLLMLSACGTTRTQPSPSLPPISLNSSQFECGPRARPLPSDEEMAIMSTRDLLELYKEAWNWGARCDGLLKQNEVYVRDSIADREELLKDLKKLR